MKEYILLSLTMVCLACAMVGKPKAVDQDAPTEDTVDYFHGEKVNDPYRWMEVAEDPKVESWVEKQTQKTERYFNANANLPKIRDRLIEIEKTCPGQFEKLAWAGGKLFAVRTVPPKHQPVLVMMTGYNQISTAEVIVDPNIMDPNGALAIDWYVPSHDGRYVAVSISRDNTEAGDLYVYDLTNKFGARSPKGSKRRRAKAAPPPPPENGERPPYEPIEPTISNVNRAAGGGDLVWNIENTGFFYTRYPSTMDIGGEGSLFQKVYYHKLSKSLDKDKLVLGDDFERLEQIELDVDSRSGRVIATVQLGRGGPFSHYLRNPNRKWQQLSTFTDEAEEILFAPKGGMYLLSRETAPRGRLHFLSSPKMPLNQAKRVVPQTNESIVTAPRGGQSVLITATRIYMVYQLGGPAEIRVFTHNGKKLDTIHLPDTNIGPNLVPLEGDEILFRADSFLEPPAWYRYDGILGPSSLTKTDLSTTYGIGYTDATVESVTVVSKDRAKVPLFIVQKNGTAKDGQRPTILMGDGGFGRTFTPTFSPALAIWLNHGGVAAFAGVRGGGEFGEGWHRAGMLVYKQNSINDFIACADYLKQNGYTSKDKLAVVGKGNGGLLAGAAIAKNSEMAGALLVDRGIFDMLRLQYTASGEVTIGEYGSVNEAVQFQAMLNYSPYHNLERRSDIPSTLLISGANDLKVAAWQSRKFAAQLQAVTKSQNPILYKELPQSGTGRSMPFMQKISEEAEKLAFLFTELGVQF